MSNFEVRTRFAPSPTGFMHIGNLRTALYEYLIAKSQGGKFVLRIEDTDRGRLVDGAEKIIYNTLNKVGLKHDEGPDIGGKFGPYIQSERKNIYKPFAEQLVKEGKAYYCFCSKKRLESLKLDGPESDEFSGYDRHCRDIPESEIHKLLEAGTQYVIRQKMPIDGKTTFHDAVFGEITVDNSELQDQILLKADGYPTYNFANVIDDHTMHITHVVRGCEYLSSTPKYNLLYEAFGWDVPTYVHLPLIMGKDENGEVSKLSKRHGSVSFDDLVKDGYLPQAIINYISLLGWCPRDNREIFSLEDLVKNFEISRISKSPAIFDYDKLLWFNSEYIRGKSLEEFTELSSPYLNKVLSGLNLPYQKIAALLQKRVSKFTQVTEMVDFFAKLPSYDKEIFINKKSKTNLDNSRLVLENVLPLLENLKSWDANTIHDSLIDLAKSMEMKNGTVMWPVRIAISGKTVTPGGAIEILDILGKDESLKRIKLGLEKLKNT